MNVRAVVGGIKASPWGWIAVGATVISAIGYVLQKILDYISEPAVVGAIVYFGVFGDFAITALITGVVAVVTGWKRGDDTVRLGLVAVAYVVLAQTILSLWD